MSTAAASLCYPRHAYQLSQKVFENAKDVGTIGYNFVAGGNFFFFYYTFSFMIIYLCISICDILTIEKYFKYQIKRKGSFSNIIVLF